MDGTGRQDSRERGGERKRRRIKDKKQSRQLPEEDRGQQSKRCSENVLSDEVKRREDSRSTERADRQRTDSGEDLDVTTGH